MIETNDQHKEQKAKLEDLRSSIQDGLKSGEPISWNLDGFSQKARALKNQEKD